MGKTKVKESKKPLTLSKVVVYILLILLAITIIIRCVGEGEHGNLHAQLSDRNSACIAFADRDLSSGGICIVQIQV